ncbi:MAG: autotransporter-associated beta strand repeat-containing protein, partial [Chthoniobacteraceae bacterium]
FNGRAQTTSTETIGDVTLRRGLSTIASNVGGTGVNSAELTLNSLSKESGFGATVLFSSNLGLIGSSNRIVINTLNGNVNANSTVGAGLTNNIIGGWAITGNNEFATYIPGLGVASLNQTGALQYERTNNLAGALATDNARLTVTTTVPSGGLMLNALTMTGSAISLNFAAGGDILNLVSGGLIGPNNNQTIGTTAIRGVLTSGGLASSGTSELYLYNRLNTLTVNSQVVDTAAAIGSGTAKTKLVLTAAGGAITLGNGTNSYTGGTVVNGGTVNLTPTLGTVVIPAATNPVDGLTINGGTVTATAAGQIAASNIVTLNGNAVLNLVGNNTLAGLVFRDDGGGSSATAVNSNSGTLAIEGNVVSTTANPSSTSILNGRVDFGSTPRTLDIGATTFNGQELAALLSDFNLQGVTGSTGGIIKAGDGVLQFNAADIYTGATTVNAGRLQIGTTNGGSRFSAYDLNGVNTGLNLNGLSTILGSLTGSGYVVNSSTTAATMTVGFDGTSTTFAGPFYRFSDATVAAVNLTKIGAGDLTLTGNTSTSTGTLTVNRGSVIYKDTGVRSFTSATAVNEGGTLTLDNTGTANVNNRLGNGPLNLNGGTFNVLGRSATATTELAGVLTLGPSASMINLVPGTGGGTVAVTFSSLSQSAGSTAILTGTNLGTDSILKFTTAPTLVPATTGILARVAVGTDFATYSATNGVTAFTGYNTPTDLNAAGSTATIKVDATTTVRDLDLARTVNAVNILDDGVTIGSNGSLLPTQGWTLTSGGVLVNGNAATISTPVLAFGAEGILRVNGSSLNVTSSITGT